MVDRGWRTLPLFESPTTSRPGVRPRARNEAESPLDLVLHIYWSAGVEAHVLGSLAARTLHPDQQHALRDLQKLDEERKDLAARSLATIWRVRLPSAVAEHADDGSDSNGRAAA